MHRNRATLFAPTPTRCATDNESIELDDMSLFRGENENSEEESEEETESPPGSYALSFAMISLEAAHKTVCESFAESREHAPANQTKLEHFADSANTVLAAPFAYCPAFIIAIFAFLSGAALDVYTAIVRNLPTQEQDGDELTNNVSNDEYKRKY